MQKKLHVYLLFCMIACFTLIAFLVFKYDFINLSEYRKIKLVDFNIQGIECIKNKIIVLENASGLYEVKLAENTFIKLADLKRLDEDVYNNINILTHPTSIVMNNNNSAFATNSMEKRSPRIVEFDYNLFLDKKYLATETVKKILVMDEYESLHIEKFSYANKNYIILAGNSNGSSVLDFYESDISKKVCRLDYNKNIQNLLWDDENERLLVFSNVLRNRGGMILEHKINFEKNCLKIKKTVKTITLTTMELEGYTYCQNKHLYAYIGYNNNSYILFK